ncbi:hypothetical protein RFI_15595, partial [Reticulomyxa filosa]
TEKEDIHTLASDVDQINSVSCLQQLTELSKLAKKSTVCTFFFKKRKTVQFWNILYLKTKIKYLKKKRNQLFECYEHLEKEQEYLEKHNQSKMKKLCQEIMTQHYKKCYPIFFWGGGEARGERNMLVNLNIDGSTREIWKECASKTATYLWRSYSPFPTCQFSLFLFHCLFFKIVKCSLLTDIFFRFLNFLSLRNFTSLMHTSICAIKIYFYAKHFSTSHAIYLHKNDDILIFNQNLTVETPEAIGETLIAHLSALGNAIAAIRNKDPHLPYTRTAN